MSYILEALRKAERERNLGQVPTLEARTPTDPDAPRRLWPWLLAGALIVNAGVLALWLFYPRAPEVPPVAEVVIPQPLPPEPAIADYLPPPTTVIEEPLREPPVVTLPDVPREPIVPAPVESQDQFVEEPAVEETAVAQDVTPLRDMPPEFRRSLPEMKMDAHFYTDVPGRSFVMINLRKYKKDERLAEGPQVIEIVSDGVILSYQGQQFLLTP
jgi:general secretion pathway protein B